MPTQRRVLDSHRGREGGEGEPFLKLRGPGQTKRGLFPHGKEKMKRSSLLPRSTGFHRSGKAPLQDPRGPNLREAFLLKRVVSYILPRKEKKRFFNSKGDFFCHLTPREKEKKGLAGGEGKMGARRSFHQGNEEVCLVTGERGRGSSS